MFGLSKLKLLLHKKALASILAAAGSAAGAYFWGNQEASMSVPERVATTKTKIMRNRPNYFKLLQDIERKGPDNIPEGLKSVYEGKDKPVMAERWAALFCEEGPHDINETNYKDYQEYCNGR